MSDNPPERDLLRHAADLYDIEAVAQEIMEYTQEPAETVWRKLAHELAQNGFNVVNETKRFGVTPHQFDQAMIDFYTQSDGFIYETGVESRHPYRISKWLRIAGFLAEQKLPARGRKVLVYGDSVGNDCIFLRRMNFEVSYHDFDSYCARFAKRRFERRNLDIRSFAPGSAEKFDYVICFEVAEHVPDPEALVAELAGLTAETGYCIFSESFGLMESKFPTHLQSNLKFVGQADAMFARHGMQVEWKDGESKPIVYTRLPSPRPPGAAARRRGLLARIRRKLRAAYHA